ncbi:acyltransferase [Parashewanella spongiae]|uniref:Acyltransferase n=1 Tax=Parashewanella spongiae TaxID=342950 RepID=A0A3A6U2G3_9GAMM|nr:acyltransferase [Parashewanella spongiae]MCL1077683.1 acyltransferase [Parashewanella spongiae]RJY18232.1 acyltransferase [Parashewanella spongiae]
MRFVHLIKRIFLKLNENKIEKYKNLRIGQFCQYSLDNLDGIAPQLITIGDHCVIAPKAVILTHDACLVPTTGKYVFKEVIIGNKVFIGYGAVIMPGVIIGDNCVIGSNSVVTKNVPSDSVYAGVPAKFICKVKELENKKNSDLTEAIFDWKKEITTKEILLQQNKLGLHNEK